MSIQDRRIEWRVHCTSSAEKVFSLLTTHEGRASFWAESAEEIDGHLHFRFPNGQTYQSRILESIPNEKFSLLYFEAVATFLLSEPENGGTDITLTHEPVPAAEYAETLAGWVSVLLALKAFADFGADIRNHDPERTWEEGYVDN